MDRLTGQALAARAGNKAALDQFLRGVSGDVWRFCAHFGPGDAIEDLTQETLMRTVAAVPGFRAEATARAWVLAIARRVCADHVRVQRRRDAALDRMRNERSPVDGLRHAEIDLFDVIDRLDPDRRSAFVLTQHLGLAYAEAATVLDCPIGTIRSRVARARADLLELLGPDLERKVG